MTSSAFVSAHATRPVAFVLALGMFVAVLAIVPPARGEFSSLRVEPGQFTGTSLYVPTETMRITISSTVAGEVYDVDVYHLPPPFNPASRVVYATFDDLDILATLSRSVTWTIPETVPDDGWYWVSVHDGGWFENAGSGTTWATYPSFPFSGGFSIRAYDFEVWTDRNAYLPGDTVTVGWSATMIKDGNPAPSGVSELQVYDDLGATLIAPNQYFFNASQGSFSFVLSTGSDPDVDARVWGWFNDTSGNREGSDTMSFDIDYLGVVMSVQPTYAPGAIVTIDAWTKVTDSPGFPAPWDPGAASVFVNVTITDFNTGDPTPYDATNLLTAADGKATHVFQLAATPTSAVYRVQVSATAYGILNAATSDTFEVRSTPFLLLQLRLDRSEYASGETATATATITPSGNYSYRWTIMDDATGDTLVQTSGSSSTIAYAIPTNFEGRLRFQVTANDGQGTTETEVTTVDVAFGYLALSLTPGEFDPGNTITATFSLRSQVITSPSYFYEVWAGGMDLVASGSPTGTSFTYQTPNPASTFYEFVVVASQDGRSVRTVGTAFQAAGFFLSIGLDRPSYLPGETMRIQYSITARGPATLPQEFRFFVSLFGSTSTTATTTSPSGELHVRIPAGTNEGDLFLLVTETTTGATASETVRVGPTNPLWSTEVAGIPAFAVILGVLLALLVVGFLFLWRRSSLGVGAGKGLAKPARPPPERPTRAPPTSPMSVPCKNCNTSIEITTSKRPIEVMCPSCGETQLIQ